MKQKNILIYSDDGASQECVNALFAYFKNDSVVGVSGAALQNNEWMQTTDLLIMPGGRSLPFYEQLGVTGNSNIIAFVRRGGCYWGLCAGAYYASFQTIFAKGAALELILPGELNFFSGAAIGPVFTDNPFMYQSESGASNVEVIWHNEHAHVAYFNGGCYFENAQQFSNTDILARYADNNLPAIIRCTVEKGCAILSGVHPELSADPSLLDQFLKVSKSDQLVGSAKK